ncbi:unnamed protein product, partial [marine sediment metagenome]
AIIMGLQMRIVLIGQAAFGEKALQTLVERGGEVVGVYTPPDIPGKTNPLKSTALQLDIPVFQPERMRTPKVYDEYIKLKPDLLVTNNQQTAVIWWFFNQDFG